MLCFLATADRSLLKAFKLAEPVLQVHGFHLGKIVIGRKTTYEHLMLLMYF